MDEVVAGKIELFFTQFKYQKYKKGELLLRTDEQPSGVFYLKKGTVKMYLISNKGDEVVLNIFKPISFFPISWVINNTQNMYYYESMSEVEVWKAPKEHVRNMLKTNSDVLYDLISRIYRGVDGVLQRMAYLMSGEAYTRLITELLILTKRFGKKNANGELVLTVTEKDLGTQIGMTRETVSREMKRLKENNIISFSSGQITISDINKLEDQLTLTF